MDKPMVPGYVLEQELERMMNAYGDALTRVCFSYLQDSALAEDAAQETFVKAYRAMEKKESRQAVSEKAWLTRIAVNTCKDMLKSRWFTHVNRRMPLEYVPEQSVPFEENDKTVSLAVLALPVKLKDVVLLYYYQHLTMEETALSLGIAKSAVHHRLKKAEEKLKNELEGWYFA